MPMFIIIILMYVLCIRMSQKEFVVTGAEAHLNTSFKHFVLFERQFHLISKKEELPLRKLIRRLIQEEEEETAIDANEESGSIRRVDRRLDD